MTILSFTVLWKFEFFINFTPQKNLYKFCTLGMGRIESTIQPEKFTTPRLLVRLSLHARLPQVLSFFFDNAQLSIYIKRMATFESVN